MENVQDEKMGMDAALCDGLIKQLNNNKNKQLKNINKHAQLFVDRCFRPPFRRLPSRGRSIICHVGGPRIGTHDEQYAVFEAFDYLGKDWDKMISIFAENAELTICWGGEEPDCVVGGVDEVLFPFHQALREFKVGTRLLVGTKNNRVFSTQWNNYFETTLGCNEVTSGVSFWELSEEGKAVRFVSTSDDGIHCVPQYHEAMAAKEKL